MHDESAPLLRARALRDRLMGHEYFKEMSRHSLDTIRQFLTLSTTSEDTGTLAILLRETISDTMLSRLEMLAGPHGPTIYKMWLAKHGALNVSKSSSDSSDEGC